MQRRIVQFFLLILTITLFPCVPHITRAAMVAKAPSALGLVGYWNFNEGQGNKVNDGSGGGVQGTLSGTALPNWTSGKSSGALNFNGSSSFVDTNVDYSWSLTDSFSMSAWVKSTEGSGNLDSIVSKVSWEYTFYKNGNTIGFNYWNSGGGDVITMSGTVANDGNWHHAVVTYDGSVTTGKLYIDGSLVATDSANAGVLQNRAETTKIGEGYSWGQGDGFMNGSIDEVRIYNRALSQSEISRLYTSTQLTQKAPSGSGLVGYWPLDEGRGNKAMDYSGNRYDASMNGSAAWVSGRKGYAAGFNGAGSFDTSAPVSFNQNSFTSVAWFKTTSTADQKIVSNNISYHQIQTLGGYLRICVIGCTVGTKLVNDGNWHFAAVVGDGVSVKAYLDGSPTPEITQGAGSAAMTGTLSIGKTGNGNNNLYFYGSIDDVRVYSRALSTAEIQKLYNSTSLRLGANQSSQLTSGMVGYWSFNGQDISGTTAYDRSGQGNNGTINGAKPDGGKVGQALSFNGTNNSVTTSLNTQFNDFTVSLWFKDDGVIQTYERLVDKNYVGGFWLGRNGSTANSWGGGILESSGPYGIFGTFPDGRWNHLVSVRSGTSHILYANGVQVNSNTVASTALDTTAVTIGNGTTNQAGGMIIDEVRIYNRALSAQEVQLLYNLGK